MSVEQLEAFLLWAQDEPSLREPLATAPDAAAVAALANAAGFAVSSEDLLLAAGEAPEVVRMVEIVSLSGDRPQSELEAFLQQVESDADLQRVVAAAPDVEGLAAVARIAGFALTAEDLWAASDEEPQVLLEPDLVLEFWPDPEDGGGAGDGATAAGQGSAGAPGAVPAARSSDGAGSQGPAAGISPSAAVAPGAPEAIEESAGAEADGSEAGGAGPGGIGLADPWGSSGHGA